ncbi:MAG: phage holin family protein [Limisphaerales bacterium]
MERTSHDHQAPAGAAAAKRLARGAFAILQTRFELLAVEIQEERERMLLALLLALGVVAFGFVAAVAATLGLAALLWSYSPVLAMVIPPAIHAALGAWLAWRLRTLVREWRTCPATIQQLKEDRECLNAWLK